MRSPFSCDIAGLYHHCDKFDHGNFEGYILPENNTFDANAIAIYTKANKLIGYIPRGLTTYVRMWAKNIDRLPCSISLEIIPNVNVYRGSVTIYDNSHKICPQFEHKKIYVCSDFTKYYKGGVVAIAESFGAVINHSLKRDTDFVIYEQSIPDIVKSKKDSPNFHFKEIHLYDFIAQGINEDEQDQRFFGKEVAFASARDSVYADLAARYLIEHGAKLVPRYRKSSTDILIKWDKWANSTTVNKAVEDGKTIINVSELLGPENSDSSNEIHPKRTTQAYNAQEKEAAYSIDNFLNSNRIEEQKDIHSDNQKGGAAGCGIILAAILIISISALMLYGG